MAVSYTHLAYAKMDTVELAAICDIQVDRAKAVAEKFGIPHVFENYEEMLELPGLDAVDICTPNYLHSIIAVKALNKGLHVFSEKPDAVSVEEVQKMQAAAEQSGKTLMVMRNNRYWETSKYLKQYIQDGKMGEIYACLLYTSFGLRFHTRCHLSFGSAASHPY